MKFSATAYPISTPYQAGVSCNMLLPYIALTHLQIIHYTDLEEDRRHCERALDMAQSILNHINETIREQEGRERLRMISNDLWIGQGYVTSFCFSHERNLVLTFNQTFGSD